MPALASSASRDKSTPPPALQKQRYTMTAIVAGRPLLNQPFTSLRSMSLQCIPTAVSLIRSPGPASLQSDLHSSITALHHGVTHQRDSLAASQAPQRCRRMRSCTAAAVSAHWPDASAGEGGEAWDNAGSAWRTRSKPSAKRHQPQDPMDSTAVIGWRVRDTTAGDQDIGVVREVQFIFRMRCSIIHMLHVCVDNMCDG